MEPAIRFRKRSFLCVLGKNVPDGAAFGQQPCEIIVDEGGTYLPMPYGRGLSSDKGLIAKWPFFKFQSWSAAVRMVRHRSD